MSSFNSGFFPIDLHSAWFGFTGKPKTTPFWLPNYLPGGHPSTDMVSFNRAKTENLLKVTAKTKPSRNWNWNWNPAKRKQKKNWKRGKRTILQILVQVGMFSRCSRFASKMFLFLSPLRDGRHPSNPHSQRRFPSLIFSPSPLPISPPTPPFDCICMWNKQINSDMQTP